MLKFSLQLINCIAVKLKTFFGDLAANAFSPKMNLQLFSRVGIQVSK